MTLKSTRLRESQSLVINYAMAPYGSSEVMPYAVITDQLHTQPNLRKELAQ